jgi:tRNA threonylcarbamoyladenosine biosynthesis protein TsaB
MNEVYVAQYRRDASGFPEGVTAPQVCAPASMTMVGEACDLGIGTGWGVHGEALARALGQSAPAQRRGEALPDMADGIAYAAAQLASSGGRSALQLQPLYLRNKVALTLGEQAQAKQNR